MINAREQAFSVKSWTRSGFTLVELIVVVTILAILATIGFVSYSSYLTGVRDTNRLSQLVSISDGLELYRTKKDLPLPDDNIEIQVNTGTIAYQGYAGSNTLETIDFTKGGKDPKDDSYFTYYLTEDRKYFQLLGFLEEEENLSSLVSSSYAADYLNRIPTVYGKKLGVLLGEKNSPAQQLISGKIDLAIDDTTGYTAYITDSKTLTGSTAGSSVLESLENIVQLGGTIAQSCKDLLDKTPSLRNKDGAYMIDPIGGEPKLAYCDMTVAGGGWTLIVATYRNSADNGVGHLAGSDAYGSIVDATTGITGDPGGKYKLADDDIKAIQDLSSDTDSADYLFNQIGRNAYYSGGNNEYLTLENYTAEWNYGGKMPNSSTPFQLTSYRRSDGAIALSEEIPANVGCNGGEFGINCPDLATYLGNGGGANCDIDLRTTPATNLTWSGPFRIYMEHTNGDSQLYACNGPQHSSNNRYKSRYFIRENN